MFCKGGNVVDSTTTHAIDYKDSIIIIRNVPCLKCDQCGETYYNEIRSGIGSDYSDDDSGDYNSYGGFGDSGDGDF